MALIIGFLLVMITPKMTPKIQAKKTETNAISAVTHKPLSKRSMLLPWNNNSSPCIQSLKMRNKETNRDLAEFFGNKWDGFR